MDPFREVRTPEKNYGPARIGGISVTPLARRLAGERGIDLTRVSGSGPRGRIVARDVEKAAPAATAPALARGAGAAQVKALYQGVAYEEVPLDAMRAHHRHPAGRGQANHPAFLSDRRRGDRPARRHARGGQCCRAEA